MPYSVFQKYVTDLKGNVLANAEVDVFRESDGSRVTDLYEDRNATSPLGNPFNATSNGLVHFYAPASSAAGYKVVATKDGTPVEFRNVLMGTAAGHDVGTSLGEMLLTRDQLDARFTRRGVQWRTISGDTTLTASDLGKSLWVTADCTITLPVWANVPTFECEIIPDSSGPSITIATQGSDTVRNGNSSVDGDAAVTATPATDTFALHGDVS